MNHILLFGRNGQLGWELNRALAGWGKVTAIGRSEVNLEEPEMVRDIIRREKPNFIVNAAAYTEVDHAETDEKRATLINGISPGVMAEESRRLGIFLIHFSTDYVFDGMKGAAYNESDNPHPLNVYGRTKLMGEKAIQEAGERYLIFRTSWVYSLRNPNCFVNRVLSWAKDREIVRVASDQIGNPTSAQMLAELTSQVMHHEYDYLNAHVGIYNLTARGFASRYRWACLILELYFGNTSVAVEKLQPALTSEFPTPAERPLYSALECALFMNVFNLSLPDWELVLRETMLGEGT